MDADEATGSENWSLPATRSTEGLGSDKQGLWWPPYLDGSANGSASTTHGNHWTSSSLGELTSYEDPASANAIGSGARPAVGDWRRTKSPPQRPLNPLAAEWRPTARLDSRIRGAQSEAAERRNAERGGQRSTQPRRPPRSGGGSLSPEDLLGAWADSLGNAILVSSVDAYELKLLAVLSQPPRRDITLAVRPVPGGGWICGNAMLDPAWSTAAQLHWLTADGRVSVWVRLQGDTEGGDQSLTASTGSRPF